MTSEKVLPYSREHVKQDTYYYCAPASCQTVILGATGHIVAEHDLAGELRTTVNGTDDISQVTPVLNKRIPGSHYCTVRMPNDPPTPEQRRKMAADFRTSINRGKGVVANIVAPPSNYPHAVAPSTISPYYSGGTVYHYVAVMGYAPGRFWIADSGFYPYGYWISEAQLASLIPPKGYSASIG